MHSCKKCATSRPRQRAAELRELRQKQDADAEALRQAQAAQQAKHDADIKGSKLPLDDHSLTGRSTAAIPAIKTVSTIVRVPAEMSLKN